MRELDSDGDGVLSLEQVQVGPARGACGVAVTRERKRTQRERERTQRERERGLRERERIPAVLSGCGAGQLSAEAAKPPRKGPAAGRRAPGDGGSRATEGDRWRRQPGEGGARLYTQSEGGRGCMGPEATAPGGTGP